MHGGDFRGPQRKFQNVNCENFVAQKNAIVAKKKQQGVGKCASDIAFIFPVTTLSFCM
jgi:hypothetical protein